MTHAAIDTDGIIRIDNPDGKTHTAFYRQPDGTYDDVAILNWTVDQAMTMYPSDGLKPIFEEPAPKPEPLPRPEVGEHIWIERSRANGDDTNYGFYVGVVTDYANNSKGEWINTDDERDNGTWWPSETLPNTHVRVVAWGLVEPERKVKWPAGSTVRRSWHPIRAIVTLTEDVFEGDMWAEYDFKFGGSHPYHSTSLVEDLERVYVVGDILPAGEPMPANGLCETHGERYYLKEGFVSSVESKIIWLEV